MIFADECMYLEESFVSLRGWGRCAPQSVHEASDQRSQGLTKANISPILYLMTQIDGLGSLPQPQSWTGQLWGLAEAVHALPQFSHARPQFGGPVFYGINILTGFWHIRNLEKRLKKKMILISQFPFLSCSRHGTTKFTNSKSPKIYN